MGITPLLLELHWYSDWHRVGFALLKGLQEQKVPEGYVTIEAYKVCPIRERWHLDRSGQKLALTIDLETAKPTLSERKDTRNAE